MIPGFDKLSPNGWGGVDPRLRQAQPERLGVELCPDFDKLSPNGGGVELFPGFDRLSPNGGGVELFPGFDRLSPNGGGGVDPRLRQAQPERRGWS